MLNYLLKRTAKSTSVLPYLSLTGRACSLATVGSFLAAILCLVVAQSFADKSYLSCLTPTVHIPNSGSG